MTEPVPMPASAKAPPGLGKAGRALWRSFSAYVFDPRESAALTAACRQADDTAAVEAIIAAGDLVVEGSKGQPTLAGALAEARQGRLAMGRLLGMLALPADADANSKTPAQLRASKAANTRWDLHRTRVGRRSDRGEIA